MQRASMEVEADLTPDRTISENYKSTKNYFQIWFLRATIRSFFFHFPKNVKSRQGSWTIPTQRQARRLLKRENIALKKGNTMLNGFLAVFDD